MKDHTLTADRVVSFRRLSYGLNALLLFCSMVAIAFSLTRWSLLGQVEGTLAQALLPPELVMANLQVPTGIEMHWRLVGLAIELVPVTALLFILWSLRSICQGFLRGELFSMAVVSGLRGAGWGLAALAVGNVVYGAGVTALVSWLASGQKDGLLAVSFSSSELGLLIIGGMMLLLSHVVAEGRRLQVESSQFI